MTTLSIIQLLSSRDFLAFQVRTERRSDSVAPKKDRNVQAVGRDVRSSRQLQRSRKRSLLKKKKTLAISPHFKIASEKVLQSYFLTAGSVFYNRFVTFLKKTNLFMVENVCLYVCTEQKLLFYSFSFWMILYKYI